MRPGGIDLGLALAMMALSKQRRHPLDTPPPAEDGKEPEPPSGYGTGRCRCGRPISTNKSACLACHSRGTPA